MPSRESFFQSSVFKLLAYLVALLVLASALAPWLYLFGKHVVEQRWLEGGWLDSLHGSLERARFSRYFNRAVLISGLVLLVPVLKWMGAGKRREGSLAQSLGLERNPHFAGHLLAGFLLAAVPLFALAGVYLSQGWYEVRPGPFPWAGVILGALGTAAVVGALEEFVFRGAFYSILGRVLSARAVFWVVAFVFAILHFFNPPGGLEVTDVNALSGFWVIGQIFGHFFSQFGNWTFLLAEFAVLFAIGLVLGHVRESTRSLWMGIGLHAGWVFGVKTLSPLIARQVEAAALMPWVGDNFRVGLVSALVVLLTGGVLWCWLRSREQREPVEAGGAAGGGA